MLSPITTSPSVVKGLGLAPVAVKPEFQNQGVGSQLIHSSLIECKADGFDFIVLLGSLAYYHRFGFQTASAFGLQSEYEVDEEFTLLPLSDRELPKGLVQYVDEFRLFAL